MKIALIGSGGTGKTTLLHELNKYLQLPVINENIRPWLESHGFDHFREMGLDDVRDMQQEVMFGKIKEEHSLSSFISDRTTIDNATYALYWLAQHNKYKEWYDNYHKRAIEHFKTTYDLVFILPHGVIELVDDGIRSNKKWYQYLLQQLMENMVNTNRTSYICVHKVESIGIEERVNECLNVIDKLEVGGYV